MSNSGMPETGDSAFPIRHLRKFAESRMFNGAITCVILANSIIVGLHTSRALADSFGYWFELTNQLILYVFIVEALVKIFANYPRMENYFRNGWNVFDFSIILVCLLTSFAELATVARLLRLLRLLRLASALPELGIIVSTLIRSFPSMFNIVLLISIIFYVYGVAGCFLFRDADPVNWSTLGISILTLFRIVTLEGWTDIMDASMQAHGWAWIYYVSFIVIGTFVVVNLFIAAVVNNLEEVKKERQRDLRDPPSQEEILEELSRTQQALARLQERLDARN
ncbi:MAG: ion transporter [Albidovulum sp.]|nr:ion transporter [Albidovulum sp.]